MESYRCSDVPPELYRVDYPGSRTTWTSQEGFKATDTSRTFGGNDLLDFKRSIEKSFTWSCRDPSPFISLFSDREHAENWGCREPWLGNHRSERSEGGWKLYVIDTTELRRTTLFFKLSSLVRGLSLDIPEMAQQHIEGAYLCLHRIPPAAVAEVRTPAQVEEDREDRIARHLEENDIYDYLGECGDDDSDREMLQENYNTIFENNI
ncbi:hypothetical protein MMC29_003144 [Sticta canariensis]|nr:hypothetical protein [Sticta canariensis]